MLQTGCTVCLRSAKLVFAVSRSAPFITSVFKIQERENREKYKFCDSRAYFKLGLFYFLFIMCRSKRTCCFLSNKTTQFPFATCALRACGLHHVKDVIESFLCLVLRWRLMQSGVCTRKLVH